MDSSIITNLLISWRHFWKILQSNLGETALAGRRNSIPHDSLSLNSSVLSAFQCRHLQLLLCHSLLQMKGSEKTFSSIHSVGHSVILDSLWPVDCSLPGSSVHGIFQARKLEWVAIFFSRRSSWPRGWTQVSYIAGRLFIIWATREASDKICHILNNFP